MDQAIDYDSKERPATPPHPKANEEFKTVPSVSKLSDLQIDLNPDLSDEDEDGEGSGAVSTVDNKTPIRGLKGLYRNLDDVQISQDSLGGVQKKQVEKSDKKSENIKAEKDYEGDVDEEMFESDDDDDGDDNDEEETDFENIATAKSLESPLDQDIIDGADLEVGAGVGSSDMEASHKRKLQEIYTDSKVNESLESDIEKQPWLDFDVQSPLIASTDPWKEDNLGLIHRKKLSSAQKSKLVAYIDNELLSIQRRFIQSFNVPGEGGRGDEIMMSEEAQTRPMLGYKSLPELISDLEKVTDFIWYTVRVTQGKGQSAIRSFFQGQYFIKIAGDLVDYLQKFTMDKEALKRSILYIQKLDKIFVNIIDELNGFDSTEKVRLVAITERTRIAVINATVQFGINDYKYEIGRLYEEVIDRIS